MGEIQGQGQTVQAPQTEDTSERYQLTCTDADTSSDTTAT